jgi:hypothetical protein
MNQIPLNKKLLMMNGKKPCRRNMMLSSRMRLGSLYRLHLEPNQSVASGYSKKSTYKMVHLKSTKQGSWKKDFHRKKVFIMRIISPP